MPEFREGDLVAFLGEGFFGVVFCLPCALPFCCSAFVPFVAFLASFVCLAWAATGLDGDAVVIMTSCFILELVPEDEITSNTGLGRAFWPEVDLDFELNSSCFGVSFLVSVFLVDLASFRCFGLPFVSETLILFGSAWAMFDDALPVALALCWFFGCFPVSTFLLTLMEEFFTTGLSELVGLLAWLVVLEVTSLTSLTSDGFDCGAGLFVDAKLFLPFVEEGGWVHVLG